MWASGEVQPWAIVQSESPPEVRKNGTKYTINGGRTNEGADIRD